MGGNPKSRAFLSRGAGVLPAKLGSAHVLTRPGPGRQPSPRRLVSGHADLHPARTTLTTLAGCISLRDIRVGRPPWSQTGDILLKVRERAGIPLYRSYSLRFLLPFPFREDLKDLQDLGAASLFHACTQTRSCCPQLADSQTASSFSQAVSSPSSPVPPLHLVTFRPRANAFSVKSSLNPHSGQNLSLLPFLLYLVSNTTILENALV